MEMDIRLPVGILFVAIGAILGIQGFVADIRDATDWSNGWDINLVWGIVMATFGAIMCALSAYSAIHVAKSKHEKTN